MRRQALHSLARTLGGGARRGWWSMGQRSLSTAVLRLNAVSGTGLLNTGGDAKEQRRHNVHEAVQQQTDTTVAASKIHDVQLDRTNRWLSVEWSDATKGRYPFVWLRDCSLDPVTYHMTPQMTARKLFMTNFDVNVVPTKIDFDEGQVRVEWPDGVKSVYDSDWLRFRNLDSEQQRKLRRKVYLEETNIWEAGAMPAALQRFQWDEVKEGGRALHDWLLALCQDGLALIEKAPAELGVCERIGELIGVIQNTHFGRVFTVSVKPDAGNMAYANSGELPLHTDFPSLRHKPELQMLHVIQRAEKGGESMFVDGFAVAERLRREHPDHFRLLTTVPLEYIEKGRDHISFHCVARRPVICLHPTTGRPDLISFGNAMRSWFYDCPVEQIQPMYEALRCFADLCYHPDHLIELPLNNGDVVLWANNRLLHARRAFTLDADRPPRTFEGCYFEWMYVHSRIREIRDRLDLPDRQPAA